MDRAARWVGDARQRIRTGSLLVIDYGVPLTAELAARPWRDWLRTYRGNERGTHYLDQPGSQDITIDVPFDQLPEPDVVRTQAQFLQLLGCDDLVEEGRRFWTENASRPGLDAMRMRSRISEAEALLDPSGLGSVRSSPSGVRERALECWPRVGLHCLLSFTYDRAEHPRRPGAGSSANSPRGPVWR